VYPDLGSGLLQGRSTRRRENGGFLRPKATRNGEMETKMDKPQAEMKKGTLFLLWRQGRSKDECRDG
jgi:hypothetical protein